MMEQWDLWKTIDKTAAACSASFFLLSNEVVQRTRNSIRFETSLKKNPTTSLSLTRASSSSILTPGTKKDGLGRATSNLKISEKVQELKVSSESLWDAFHHEQQTLHVPSPRRSGRGLQQTDSIQTSENSSEYGDDGFTLYQGFTVPQHRPPPLDKGDSDATLASSEPRQVSPSAIDDPLQLHSDSRRHKSMLYTHN